VTLKLAQTSVVKSRPSVPVRGDFFTFHFLSAKCQLDVYLKELWNYSTDFLTLLFSVVMTTELSPPLRWLATIEHRDVLQCARRSFWALFTAPHFGSVIWSLRERECTARSVGGRTVRPAPHVCFPTRKWDSSDSL